MSFPYNIETYPRYPSYPSYPNYPSYEPPKPRSSAPVWLIVLIIVFVAMFELCRRICHVQGETRARQRFDSSQTRPRVALISDMSNGHAHPRPVQFVSYRIIDEYETAASRLGERLAQPLPNRPSQVPEESTQIRPPIRNDSVPQYEGPPNYEEALILLNVNQKKKDHDTPIT